MPRPTSSTVVELSGRDVTAAGFNEHVWYDYPTIAALAESLADAFSAVDPAGAGTYAANAAALTADLDSLIAHEASIADRFGGAGVVITEPVPALCARRRGTRQPDASRVQRGDRGGHRHPADAPARGARPHRRRVGVTRHVQPADRWPADRRRAHRRRRRGRAGARRCPRHFPPVPTTSAGSTACSTTSRVRWCHDGRTRPLTARRRPDPGRPVALAGSRPRCRSRRVHRGARSKRLRQDQPAQGGARAASADRGDRDASRRTPPTRRPTHRLHPPAEAPG